MLAALGIVLLAAGGVAAAALSGTISLPLLATGSGVQAPPPLGTLPEIVVAAPEHVREPEWAASAVGQDPFCGSFFDSCIRVQCSVSNTGDAAGTASVTATLRGEAEHQRSASIHLRAGERQVLTFAFPEVHADERYDEVLCRARTESIGERGAEGPAASGEDGEEPGNSEESGEITDTISME